MGLSDIDKFRDPIWRIGSLYSIRTRDGKVIPFRRFHEYDEAQASTLFAGTHARGGANSFLWISEWGFVQCEDLRRSEEILTGAIPSAKDGIIIVETLMARRAWRAPLGHREEGP